MLRVLTKKNESSGDLKACVGDFDESLHVSTQYPGLELRAGFEPSSSRQIRRLRCISGRLRSRQVITDGTEDYRRYTIYKRRDKW